jgi:ankyrin repeat protein
MKYFYLVVLSASIVVASHFVLYPLYGVWSWYIAALLISSLSFVLLRRKHAPREEPSKRSSQSDVSPLPATSSETTSTMGDTSDIDAKLLSEVHRKNRQTSLHIAAASNQLDVAQELVRRGVEINVQNIWGATPLHLAVSNDNYEMTRLLLLHGAKATIANEKGETALDLAAALGRSRLVSLLKD